ncbi:MAG: hypothetical protein NTW35_02550 [Candidatus Nomurabacteria bacterium]|nr:hypothetical protein [Candidatus Nomurabacteria bacterium]
MNLEKTPNPNEQQEMEPASPTALVERMTSREQEVENKIKARADGVEKLIETLPENERDSFVKTLATMKDRANSALKLTLAGGAFLMAMNSPAFAQENNTEIIAPDTSISASVETSNKNTVESGVERSTLALYTDVAKTVIEASIENKIDAVKKDAETVSSDNSKPQEKIDASLGLASNIPSKLLGSAGSLLSSLKTINDLQKDIQDPKVSTSDILKKLGRTILDMKTLGFGTKILDFLSEKA